LFSPKAIENLISNIRNNIEVDSFAEISLESNPGSLENEEYDLLENLSAIQDSGITRLSIGIQSFDDNQLKKLGRLYNGFQALRFLNTATDVFKNINVDIMYGNPNQSIKTANNDLTTAISFAPNHFSLYQLAIEPNTFFYKNTPSLPNEDQIWEMYTSNLKILEQHGYSRYEVSAFSLPNKKCMHNLNYWQFGDYIGIGAGAHSKITNVNSVERQFCKKNPKDYIKLLQSKKGNSASLELPTHRTSYNVHAEDLTFEFMLNGLRLVDGIDLENFSQLTGCSNRAFSEGVNVGIQKGLLELRGSILKPSASGFNFLNDLQLLFMPKKNNVIPISAL
jgi:oxygen-independent coproporphyrinogen-3 oxidase